MHTRPSYLAPLSTWCTPALCLLPSGATRTSSRRCWRSLGPVESWRSKSQTSPPGRASHPHPAWNRIKAALAAVFVQGGGDYCAGQRTYGLLRRAGLEDVQVRAAVVALHDRHPYMEALTLRAASLRRRIVEGGLLSEADLDEATAACEQLIHDPDTLVLTFITTQVWGRKPGG